MLKYLCFLLMLPITTFEQTLIKGKIINSITKLPIPYVTVGLVKENIGSNATVDGFFLITSNKKIENDSLIFSCVGYKTLKLPIHFNSENISIVELIENISELTEVIVSSKKNFSVVTLNDFSNCGNSFVGSSGYQTQLAQHFQLENKNSLLVGVKICRASIALIAPEKTIFRLRIYSMDTLSKAPSKDLCNQIIEVITRRKTINLNLEKYKIYIPDKDFFVAIEWLKIPFNENKFKVKINGDKVDRISYRPSIGWTDNVNSKMEAWMLNYKNEWHPMFQMNNKTSVSIAATVKY